MAIFRRQRTKVGLALGGGGARGMAHIGVLKVLEREMIPIDFIVGTSAGSIIGAMYAQLVDAGEVEKRVLDYTHGEVFQGLVPNIPSQQNRKESGEGLLDRMVIFLKQQYILTRSFTRMGLLGRKVLDEALEQLLGDGDVRDTRIPFAAVATDVWSGEDVVLREGSLRKAVGASSTVPGTFPPVEWNGWSLIDGGVINMVPVWETFEMGAKVVVAVDVARDLIRPKEFKNGLEIMFRADEITNYRLNNIHLKDADVVIQPQVGEVHWANFTMIEELVKQGEQAAEEKLAEIHDVIKSYQRSKFYKLLLGSYRGESCREKKGSSESCKKL